ncbi:flagellar protein FlaG [Candidatus Neomarinimicrobiota bacterium]
MVETIHNISAASGLLPDRSTSGQVTRSDADRSSRTEAVFAKSDGGRLNNGQGSTEVSTVVEELNNFVHQVSSTKVTFDVDEETGEQIIRVLNKETGEVIRQVPAEELINLAARMDQLKGLIFSEEV